MATKWRYHAELIAACSCDWGCPCNFNAKPTQGYCEGAWGAQITSGSCGDTKLDGVKYVWSGHWPRALHEGNGTAKIWVEQTASAPQREALEAMLKGRHDGAPWVILAATIDHWLDTAYVPFEWKFDGPRSSFKAGTEIQATLDSMRNPVSGAEASATILLPNGSCARSSTRPRPGPSRCSPRG